MPWSGGKPAQLTRTHKSSESQPRFGKDGKSLFYLCDAGKDDDDEDKDAVTQLWLLKGSRARKVTDIPGGVSDFDLSPDGKRAVVVAEVGLTVGSKAENPPPIETERFLFKRDGDGYLDDRSQQLFIVDLATGKARQLTTGDRDHWHHPSGRLTARLSPTPPKNTVCPTATLTTKCSCRALKPARRAGSARSTGPTTIRRSRPAWSPDSRRLVWLEGGDDKWIYYSSARFRWPLSRPAR